LLVMESAPFCRIIIAQRPGEINPHFGVYLKK